MSDNYTKPADGTGLSQAGYPIHAIWEDEGIDRMNKIMTEKLCDRKCEDCMFYLGDDYDGACRRNPPQAIRQRKFYQGEEQGEETGWAFPSVDANSSCGEWKEAYVSKTTEDSFNGALEKYNGALDKHYEPAPTGVFKSLERE